MKLLYVEEPTNPISAVHFFMDETSAVAEADYGDCMREWNRELLYFRDNLHHLETRYRFSPWIFQKLNQMQEYIQFTPNWDVDSTKKRILQDTQEIKEHLLLSEQTGRAA